MRALNSVYKDKQFLVFDFDDHKSVKYDFSTKKAYGLSGKEVENLNTQLTGITMQNIIDKCKDQNYARMMRTISGKFDKYPRNFLTTHKIASRNYDRFKKEFNEDLFAKTFNHNMECKIDNYVFICPKVTQDIKDEAVAMNNCVASYIDDVINGYCNILFMRNADKPDESLVTLEVVNGKIVQAKRRYNTDVTSDDRDAICKWEERYKKFLVE